MRTSTDEYCILLVLPTGSQCRCMCAACMQCTPMVWRALCAACIRTFILSTIVGNNHTWYHCLMVVGLPWNLGGFWSGGGPLWSGATGRAVPDLHHNRPPVEPPWGGNKREGMGGCSYPPKSVLTITHPLYIYNAFADGYHIAGNVGGY